jgi:hypothetical protein
VSDEPLAKLSSERALNAMVKLVEELDDPRLVLFMFFLRNVGRPFTRTQLLRSVRADVVRLSGDQVDRALSYLFQKNFLGKVSCGKETLYFPVL